MSKPAILERLAAAGITLTLVGDNLKFQSLKPLSTEQAAWLKEHKAGLIRALRALRDEAAAALAYWRGQGVLIILDCDLVQVEYDGCWNDFTRDEVDSLDSFLSSPACLELLQAEADIPWPEDEKPAATPPAKYTGKPARRKAA